jgi:hypothetical protein
MTTVAGPPGPEAAASAERARGERDRIQANLLELDQSLGKRILDGAAGLAGRTAGQWERARARQAADTQRIFYEYENSVRGLLGRRDELRGLLGAYQAKAAALDAAEDVALPARYRRAQDLLWTAGREARS